MRPETLDSVVGQKKAIAVLKTLIRSSEKTEDVIPHILLNAPPGSGKTTIAKALANDIGTNLYEVNCATISTPKQLFEIINGMNAHDILFLDEVHSLSKKISECLYTILEDFCYYENGVRYDIPKITIIAASTEIGNLTLPLVSRFKFKANLEPYTDEELVEVCWLVCKAKKFRLNKDIAMVIAKTCRSTPREMVSRAEWLYAYMRGNDLKSVDKSKVLSIIELQGYNADGLQEHDIQYLKLLSKSVRGLSLRDISSKMSMDSDNIKNLIEPYLMKLGLIEVATRGRKLTKAGRDYVENLQKKS